MVGEEKRNSSPSSEYQHPLMQEIKTERFTNFEQTNIFQLKTEHIVPAPCLTLDQYIIQIESVAEGKPLAEESRERLHHVDEVMNEARSIMQIGRGNIEADSIKSNGLTVKPREIIHTFCEELGV